MKKSVMILLALMLCFAFTACGSASEEAAGDEDGQNPVMNFVGMYGKDRATVLVEAEGSDSAKITVTWASSAAENSEWIMSGAFDADALKVEYSDCVKTNNVYDDNGDIASQEEQYTGGHGVIQFIDGDELALTWQDDEEHVADDVKFKYVQ